jgi:hypothetical protein
MARAHTEANQSRPANKKRVETTAAEWRQARADISGERIGAAAKTPLFPRQRE